MRPRIRHNSWNHLTGGMSCPKTKSNFKKVWVCNTSFNDTEPGGNVRICFSSSAGHRDLNVPGVVIKAFQFDTNSCSISVFSLPTSVLADFGYYHCLNQAAVNNMVSGYLFHNPVKRRYLVPEPCQNTWYHGQCCPTSQAQTSASDEARWWLTPSAGDRSTWWYLLGRQKAWWQTRPRSFR